MQLKLKKENKFLFFFPFKPIRNLNKFIRIGKILLICIALICQITSLYAQTSRESKPAAIDVEKERPVIESLDNKYSEYLLNGDSVSIANMYASDGMIGGKKGPEILSSLGSWIRSSIKNDTRHVDFKVVTLNADGDLLIETGIAEGRSDTGELKYTFRYLVVWKKEDGIWKLYRDVPL